MESEKEKEGKNINNILNQEFFDTIKLSKKINLKIQKIKDLNDYFKKTPNYIEIPEIKNKMQDLLNLLLTNLNENNNNYVLAQMELIKTLSKTINKEENYKNFIKSSLSKLFDKFYLGNSKINDTLIEIFDQFISFKILSIKDYYQYIENIPLEEEEDIYRLNIISFLYNHISKDESVLLNNLPKPINELIKKLVNDNESDISEMASKILNILINRDIESNKKKEEENKEKAKDKDNNTNNEKGIKDSNNNEEYKGKSSAEIFVKNIVSAIKKESDKDESKTNINNDEKKEEKKEEILNNKIIEENKNNENKDEKKEIISDNKCEEKKEDKDKIEEKMEKEKTENKLEISEEKNIEVKTDEKQIENNEKKEEKNELKTENKQENKEDITIEKT